MLLNGLYNYIGTVNIKDGFIFLSGTYERIRKESVCGNWDISVFEIDRIDSREITSLVVNSSDYLVKDMEWTGDEKVLTDNQIGVTWGDEGQDYGFEDDICFYNDGVIVRYDSKKKKHKVYVAYKNNMCIGIVLLIGNDRMGFNPKKEDDWRCPFCDGEMDFGACNDCG